MSLLYKWELWPLAYTIAIATVDLSCICDLHHRSQQQLQILNPTSKERDQTCALMDTSQIHFPWATMGTPTKIFQVWNLISFSLYVWFITWWIWCFMIPGLSKKRLYFIHLDDTHSAWKGSSNSPPQQSKHMENLWDCVKRERGWARSQLLQFSYSIVQPQLHERLKQEPCI